MSLFPYKNRQKQGIFINCRIFFLECFAVSKKHPIFALAFEKEVSSLRNGVVVQLVRIPACHAGGRGFESRPYRQKRFAKANNFKEGWSVRISVSTQDFHSCKGGSIPPRTTNKKNNKEQFKD